MTRSGIVVALLLVVVGGCTSTGTDSGETSNPASGSTVAPTSTAAPTVSADGSSVIGRVDGPVLSSPPISVDGLSMHAIVKGTVVFDVGSGCLLLELEDTRYPVVWPAGAEWQVDPPGVVLHGQLIESGMSVHGGGGYLYDTGIEYRAGREVADAAAQCLGPTGEVAFFNSGDTVTVDTN